MYQEKDNFYQLDRDNWRYGLMNTYYDFAFRIIENIKKATLNASSLLSNYFELARNKLAYFARNKLAYFQKVKELLAKRKFPKIRLRFVVVVVICLLALGGIYRLYVTQKPRQSKKDNSRFSQVIPIGKTLKFPAINSAGKYTGEISLTVVSAEKTNEVLVKNKPVRTKQGKFFLITNLELENESTEKLGLVSSDLIRLRIGENGRRIAPDLHNRQVLIAPVSVKTDKVGFVVTGSENIPLALELGEFYKSKDVKEKINLKF